MPGLEMEWGLQPDTHHVAVLPFASGRPARPASGGYRPCPAPPGAAAVFPSAAGPFFTLTRL